MAYSVINIQRNPGRGAGVIQKKNVFPDPTGKFKNGNQTPLNHLMNQLPPQVGALGGDVSFDNGRLLSSRQVRLNIGFPKAFFDILGPGQARVEVEGLKRDIEMMTKSRIQDAINRKIAGNDDLVRDNEILRTAVNNLQHIIVNNNRQSERLQLENSKLAAQLEKAANKDKS